MLNLLYKYYDVAPKQIALCSPWKYVPVSRLNKMNKPTNNEVGYYTPWSDPE